MFSAIARYLKLLLPERLQRTEHADVPDVILHSLQEHPAEFVSNVELRLYEPGDRQLVASMLTDGARSGHFTPELLTESHLHRSISEYEQFAAQARRGEPSPLMCVIVMHGRDRIGLLVTMSKGPSTIEAHVLFVLPEYRRRGLARHVMGLVLEAAREKGCSVVGRCYNASAHMARLLIDLGFRPTKRTPTVTTFQWK